MTLDDLTSIRAKFLAWNGTGPYPADALLDLFTVLALAERPILTDAARLALSDPEAYAAVDAHGVWRVWHGNACHQETPEYYGAGDTEHYGAGDTEQMAWRAALTTATSERSE